MNKIGHSGRLYLTQRIWVPQKPLQMFNLWMGHQLSRYMPRLPIWGHKAEEKFPELKILQQEHEIIKNELLPLLRKKQAIPNVDEIHPRDQRISSPLWRTYILKLWGHEVRQNTDRCPRTKRILDHIPRLHTALFSILDGHATIPPHRGWAAGVIRCHYPLITPKHPENCFMTVSGRRFPWREKRLFLFDDTQEHSVANNTSDLRVVLIMDFEPKLPFRLNLYSKFRYHVIRKSKEIQQIYKNAIVAA